MKKMYMTLVAAMIATTSFSQQLPVAGKLNVKPSKEFSSLTKEQLEQRKSKTVWAPENFGAQASRKAPAKTYPAIQGELITEQPAGTLKHNLYGKHNGYYYFWGYVFDVAYDGVAEDVVFGDDGSVYIKNPISTIPSDAWLKGTKTVGDTIEVALPQPVYHQDEGDGYEELTAYATKMNMEFDEEYQSYWPVADSISPNVKFVYKNDTLRLVSDGSILLALCDETGAWYGYGDYYKSYNEVKETPLSVPATVASEAQTYMLTYVTDDSDAEDVQKDITLVKVAQSGNDVYISDLYDDDDNVWIKGTISGPKMTVQGHQYLGVPNGLRYHMYGSVYDSESVYDDYYEQYVDSLFFVDEMSFTYAATSGTFTGENLYLGLNAGVSADNIAVSYKQPVLAPYVEKPGKPATPTFNAYFPYFDYYGYNIIQFKLTTVSEDGNYLDPSKIYYNVYLDGEKYTFYADEYEYLEDDMTDVPYSFTDSYDIYASGKIREVSFYSTGYDKIGVVEVFVADDGTKYESDMMVYDIAAAGIEGTSMKEEANVTSVSYTDISGRQVSKPQHGFYIKTVKHADGTTTNKKMLVK